MLKIRSHPAAAVRGFVDLHAHVLPGLDDGAGTIEESVAMVRAAISDGIDVIAATPHVRSDYPTSVQKMRVALDAVTASVTAQGLPIRVLPGAEVAVDMLEHLQVTDFAGYGLAGNPHYLLIEFPYFGWPLSIRYEVAKLLSAQIVPVLAHPERNSEVQAEPKRLLPLVEMGALIQLTAASVAGHWNRRAQKTSVRLIHSGLAHLIATDAHSADSRRSSLSAAASCLNDPGLARWLLSEAGRAIVDGEELPAPPKRRHWRRRVRRY